MSLNRILDVNARLEKLRADWDDARHVSGQWNIIRQAYSLKLPQILSGGCSPYFLEWRFTPIEYLAWQDIRGNGLRLYPQFPAGPYFIDFADPVLQIGVELDGAAYHSREKDEPRDERLWDLGWRIFRIPGREALPSPEGYPWDADEWGSMDGEARRREYGRWGKRWSEGFFFALKYFYYARPKVADLDLLDVFRGVLCRHRYVEFPIDLDGEDD